MQNVQFKLLHRILTTNTYIKIYGIQSDNSCSFCFNEPDSLEHLFVIQHELWILECGMKIPDFPDNSRKMVAHEQIFNVSMGKV